LSTAKTDRLAAGISVGRLTWCGYSVTKLFLFDRVGVFAPPLRQIEELLRTDQAFEFRCSMAQAGDTSPRSLRVAWQIHDKEIDIAGFAEQLRTAWLDARSR
jgi:hypothetical protein